MGEQWRLLVLALSAGVLIFAILGPLEQLAREGNLTAHVAQHLLLGDIVAPLALLGLPMGARTWIGSRLAHAPQVVKLALSPPAALVIWASVTTVWYLAPIHRAAVPPGPIHVLDHVSFVLFGLLVWLAVFDVRPGGLPWWGRHVYAVGSRALILPAALIVWFGSGYENSASEQVDAATLLIGFEMFLFVLALLLAFIALAIHEGREA